MNFIFKKIFTPLEITAKALIRKPKIEKSKFLSNEFNANRRPAKAGLFLTGFTFVIAAVLFILLMSYPAPAQSSGSNSSAYSDTISLDVKGMDVIDVLKILADEGGFNISVSGNVTGRVTLFLKDIGVWDALEIVLVSTNLAYEKKGDIIYVTTERDYELKYGKKYWDKKDLRVFNLKHAKAGRVKDVLSQLSSSIGKVVVDEPTNTVMVIDIPEKIAQMVPIVEKIDKPLVTKVFVLNYLSVANVQEQITQNLTKDIGFIKIDEVSNKIIVADYPEKIAEVGKMIAAFDEKPLQVLIDAKIIEIKPSRKFYAGINWDFWMRKHFRAKGTFTFPTTSTDKFSLGTVDTTDAGEVGQYAGIMEFLEIFGESKVLSSPRILVLNNQEAKILVGTKDAYVTSQISQSGDTTVTSQTVEFVDVGVKLYVTPTINRKGYITLKIKPEISSSQRETIKTQDQETQIPIVTTSEAETTVVVKDGVSIIIGGLRKLTREKQTKQIPFFGKIPFFGRLFRNKSDEWAKNELVIILTPRIISGDRSIEEEISEKIEEAMGERDVSDEYARQERAFRRQMEKNTLFGDEAIEFEDEYIYSGYGADLEIPKEELEDKERSYYWHVMHRVQETASLFSEQEGAAIYGKSKKQGKVRLSFVISENGRLVDEPQVIVSDTDKQLDDIAKLIIKRASPFLPLPAYMDTEETFEVLLIF